ncbi:hypothetical protein [Caloramator fervidus]|uniref:hypothetical protein n=1 Tax=Caloramator fervidus TaxID=29344 RepID=UPI000CDF2AAD|nr:hypothetical protein [Caloramator fervidus]
MLSIIRSGPKMVVFGCKNPKDFELFLLSYMQGLKLDIDSALDFAIESSTIVLITEPNKNIARYKDIISSILIPIPFDEFFARMFNLKGYEFVNDCHIAPGIILIRTLGDGDKIIETIKNEYNGKLLTLHESLDEGTYQDTIICFTDKSLDKKINIHDINSKTILVNMTCFNLLKRLRTQVLRFLNEGLIGVEWNEVYIRIYDRYSEYRKHYERLSVVLDNFDLGIILGETWTKDYPRFMMSILVYQVRLFTLKNPKEIKKILLGLEYFENGERLVDLDLIFRNKKISWSDILNKDCKGLDRKQLGLKFREEILNNLDDEMKGKILRLEEDIRKTRI